MEIRPDVIYHYTSLHTFNEMIKGIDQDHRFITFWASDVRTMNDPSEMSYGFEEVKKFILKWEEDNHVNESDRLSHYFQPEYSTDFTYPSLYAVSFSADSNNLAMWNMYGDNRRGVNIHILNSSVEFHSNFEEPIVGADFLNVKYDSISENSIIGKIIIKDYLQYLKDKRDGKSFIFGNAFELNKIMLNGIAELKHRTYKYENETRISVISNSPTNEREVDGKIIPYVELKIPLSWVEGVTFGSLVDDTQISFYKKKLEEKGLGNINIDKAVIPFRE